MRKFKKFINDNKAGSAVAIKGLTIIIILVLVSMVVIDIFYIGICYNYLKTQMDMSNRAVYKEIDPIQLADRKVYIDEIKGKQTFYNYLKKNIKLDDSLVPKNTNLRIVGPIEILDFEIYNEARLPAETTVGVKIDQVGVYSRVKVEIKTIFFGIFGNVTIEPHIVTDLPDKLLKFYHPI